MQSCIYVVKLYVFIRDVGGAIKDFMADYKGLRSHSRRQGCIFDILQLSLIDLMRCVHTIQKVFTMHCLLIMCIIVYMEWATQNVH